MKSIWKIKRLFNFGVIPGLTLYLLVILTSYKDIYQITTAPVFSNILLYSSIFTVLSVNIIQKKASITIIDSVLGLLIIWSIFRLYLNFEPEYASYNFRYLLLYTGAYILGRNTNKNREQQSFFIVVLLIALAEAIFAFGQINFYEIYSVGFKSANALNIKGHFSNSAMLGFLMSTGILIGVFYLKKGQGIKRRIALSLSIVFLFIILSLTTSRSALLILALGLPILFKIKWKYLVITGILTIGLFTTYKKNSIKGRVLIWKVSSSIIVENPFIGIGPNQFGAVYNNFQGKYFETNNANAIGEWVAGNNYFSFNLPLKIIIEYGFIGFVGFYLALLHLFIKIRRLPLLASIFVGYMGFSLFSYPLEQIETGFLFFVVIGICSSILKTKIYVVPSKNIIHLKVIAIVLITIILTYELILFNSIKTWESNKSLARSSPKEYIELLETQNHILKGFPEFLFHHGAILVANGYKKEALSKFILGVNRIPSSDLYVYLALCHEAADNDLEALRNYKFSTKVVPNLFVPKYYLFLYYKKQKDFVLAKKTANMIINQPIKKFNSKIALIKEEAHIFVGK